MTTTALGTLLRHIEQLTGGVPDGTDRQLLDDFATRRDEAAFAALVARHGPMVLRVCRRVLHHEQDAEDAFQATFLVLARNTGSIRKRDTLGSWLHGVAYRTAMKAKRGAARRRNHEARLRAVVPEAAAGPTWDETQAVLDEEIQRLPPAFRAAFLLCVLEGQSTSEAAAELGCKEGTVKSRVSRARRRLQQELARRGIKLAVLLAALSVAESTTRAALPAALARATVRFGLLVTAGDLAARAIPAPVASLANEMARAMFLTKARLVTAILLAVGVTAGAATMVRQTQAAREWPAGSPSTAVSPQQAGPAGPELPASDTNESVAYRGRVLGPDGRSAPGAKLYLTLAADSRKGPSLSPELATTGPDGRFAFTVPKARFGEQTTILTAAAAKLGAGWVEVPADGPRDDLTLRLVEDVPITGQIVDLEAKPVAGATLTVQQINAAPNEDPGPWLEAVKGRRGLSLDLEFEQRYLPRFTVAFSPKVTTDAAGRFRLTGIGRSRLVRVQLDGPTIASQQMYVLTRPGPTVEVPLIDADLASGTPGAAMTCYPVSFRHVAAPTQPVVGVIRDTDTRQPLPGVTVQSYRLANNPLRGLGLVRATTDGNGRYRLVGLPKGKGNKLLVTPADHQPYLEAAAEVPDPPGFEAVTVDFRLKAGIWIEGRLTDKATGRPAPGLVCYLARSGNQLVRDYPGYEPLHTHAKAHPDGTFRVVGLPGPGLLAVVRSGGHYLSARERDDEEGTRDTATQTIPLRVSTEGFVAHARIDPPLGSETFHRDVTLDPGQTLTGTVLGPDGKPLAGAWAYRLDGLGWARSPLPTASFAVQAFNPRRPRPVLFLHPEKWLVGVLEPPADRTAAVCVRMGPGAAVTGRLVDADGQPRANVELLLGFRDRSLDMWVAYHPDTIRTGPDGRFRIEALPPGQGPIEALLPGRRFLLSDGRGGEMYFGNGLRGGETKDLGDVQIKR